MKKLFIAMVAFLLAAVLASAALAEYKANPDLVNTEAKLTLYGPGIFSKGREDTTDLLTGEVVPGYHKVIERWNKFYPNCTLDIQEQPWDSWQTAIMTACLSGDVDIILHGASMTGLTEDLSPYLKADPEYASQIQSVSSRYTENHPNVVKVSGIPVSLAPMVVWLDKKIFKDYGVELPKSDWTYDDLLNLAEKLTGTDPVTGEQTYGLQMYAMGANNIWFNYVLAANALGAEVYKYGDTLKDCKVDYESPESIAAFDMLARLAKYMSPEDKEGLAVSESLDGKNNWAMWFNEGTDPYFQMKGAKLEDRYAVINAPVCAAGQFKGKPTPHAGEMNLAIFKDSKNKQLAWEFIKFMTTDPEMVEWVVQQGYLPNNKEGFKAVTSKIDKEYTGAYSYALETTPEDYNNATNGVMNNVAFGPTTANLITAVTNVINGYVKPDYAARMMQNGIDEYLKNMAE